MRYITLIYIGPHADRMNRSALPLIRISSPPSLVILSENSSFSSRFFYKYWEFSELLHSVFLTFPRYWLRFIILLLDPAALHFSFSNFISTFIT